MSADLVSGEGVRLDLTTAGVGSRLIAALIDLVVMFAAILLLALIDNAVAGGSDSAGFQALVTAEFVLVAAGYPIMSEWLSHGRTLGKAAMGLRTVRDDGGPISFRQALVRGLAGFILEKPGLLPPISTLAGVITLTGSRRDQRIGDLMAGTIVLNERAVRAPLSDALSLWVPPELQQWVLSLDLHRLDDALALSLRQFVGRANGLTDGARYALGEDLRTRLVAVLSPSPPAGAATPALLVSVLAERRRRAQAGTPGPWQPAYGPPAPGAAPGSFTAPS